MSTNFQKPISKKSLEAIIHRALQNNLIIKRFTEIKTGRFNTIYKLDFEKGNPIILRIAPSQTLKIYHHEQYLLRKECTIYPHLSTIKKYLPKILFTDFTKEVIERDYVIHSFIEGSNWDKISHKLSLQQNINLWKKVSDVSELISQAEGTRYGLPDPSPQFSSWGLALANILEDMIRDLKKYSLKISEPQKLLKIITANRQYLDKISTPKLTHGDLWPKNVLIKNDKNLQILGILDSERAFWGDPKAEWIILNTNFAGQKSRKDYTFRCGLFSADYSEVPTLVAKRYKCNNEEEIFRQQVYLGIYLTQRRLESQRFPRDEKWIEEEFNNVFANLSRIMTLL